MDDSPNAAELRPPNPKRKHTLRWVAAVSVAGCISLWLVWAALRGPTDGLSDVYEMKRVILEHVPIGTEIDDAREFMLQEGFECEEYTDSIFTMNASDSGGSTRHGLDFLYCGREDPAGWQGVRNWGVALIVADGVVAEVLVRSSVFGP